SHSMVGPGSQYQPNLVLSSEFAVGSSPNLIRSALVLPAGCCRANQVRVFRLLDALGLSNLVRAAVFWPADADRANQVRGVSPGRAVTAQWRGRRGGTPRGTRRR